MADNYENVVIPEVPRVIDKQELYIYVPIATANNLGIAKFDNNTLNVVNGLVSVKQKYIDKQIGIKSDIHFVRKSTSMADQDHSQAIFVKLDNTVYDDVVFDFLDANAGSHNLTINISGTTITITCTDFNVTETITGVLNNYVFIPLYIIMMGYAASDFTYNYGAGTGFACYEAFWYDCKALYNKEVASYIVTLTADNKSIVTAYNADGVVLPDISFTIERVGYANQAKADEQNSRIATTYVRDITVNVLGNHHTTLGIKRKKVDDGTLVDDIVSKLIPSVFQAFVDSHNADLSAKLNNLIISDDLLHLVGKRSNGNDMQISVIDLIAQTLINYYSLDNSKTLKENIASVFASESRDITQKGNFVVQGNGGFQGNVQIGGSLNVAGRVISEDVEYLNVKDRIIALNYGIADNTALAGIAIITSATNEDNKYNAFGIMFDPNESHLGSSVVGGFGILEKTTSGGNDVYRFTFNNGQSHPLALRDGLVDGNLVKYDGATHTLTDSGKNVDDFYYEGQTKGVEGEFVGVNDQGKIGLIAMADPVLNKYFTPTAVSPKVIDYYGAFSVQFSAFPENATQIRVTIGSTYNFDLILDDTPEIEEFAVYYNGNAIYTNNYIETADGKIYCDFSVYDLSAYVSFNLLRNLAVTLSVTYTGDDNPSYALKGYLSAKVLDYVLTQIYANDDTKLNKVGTTTVYTQVYAKSTSGNQVMLNAASGAAESSIMQRRPDGCSQVTSPIYGGDIANKKYTDDADSALVFGIVDGD